MIFRELLRTVRIGKRKFTKEILCKKKRVSPSSGSIGSLYERFTNTIKKNDRSVKLTLMVLAMVTQDLTVLFHSNAIEFLEMLFINDDGYNLAMSVRRFH